MRKNSSFSYYGPKVFAWTELPKDRALMTRCIVIPMHETDRTDLNRLTDPGIRSAAEDLQKQFLQFRLEKLNTSPCLKGVERLHSRNRDLYEALGFPVAEDEELCRVLAWLLSQQEQFTREPLSVRQVAVLTVLAIAAHVPERSALLVGDVTRFANEALAHQDESIRLTAHAVGALLTSFGIQCKKRTNKGWLLEFDQELQRKTHLLIKRYRVDCNFPPNLFDALPNCKLCNDLQLNGRDGGAPERS